MKTDEKAVEAIKALANGFDISMRAVRLLIDAYEDAKDKNGFVAQCEAPF